ncbi:hypothetical protein ACRU1U_15530 [Providencia stuartii]|uniref:hypothetical protein n=1 Tax=Providencia stuartii TaxID=588 RepID=UPI003D7F427E
MKNIFRLLLFRLKRRHEKAVRFIAGWRFIICNEVAIDDIYVMTLLESVGLTLRLKNHLKTGVTKILGGTFGGIYKVRI